MDDLRDQLLAASDEGEFLLLVYKASLDNPHSDDVLAEELAKLHNEGSVDVISAFRSLQNSSDTGVNFWLTRHVLEKVLPRLDAPILQVMECVLHLVKEAGQDMAAGTLISPFIDFCAAHPSRPEEALKLIERSIDKYVALLEPTLIAGARLDIECYLNESLRMVSHEDIEVRRRVVFSLGRFRYPEDSNLFDKALACLESSVSKETDDILLGNLVKSAFELYKQHDDTQAGRITSLVNSALMKGKDFALHAASELFGYCYNELREPLLDTLLINLLRIKPVNKGSLDSIDYGLAQLFEKGEQSKGIEFIEKLLLANPDNISLSTFDSTSRELIKNKENIFSRLLTRWFLRGSRVLCEGINSIINLVHSDNLLLSVEPSGIDFSNPYQPVFIARKAIGYLFFKPISAASIIVSLIEYALDDESVKKLSNLLFDPLLINYYFCYRHEVTGGSILFPMIALWAALLGDNELYSKIQAAKEKHLSHCNFQFWYPDDSSEEHFYTYSDAHGATLSHVCIDHPINEFLDQAFTECKHSPQFESLSAVENGFWPIVLIACRHYRLPVPLHLCKGFYVSEQGS
jgi:tetratricopeptide (TPR) repeat protein